MIREWEPAMSESAERWVLVPLDKLDEFLSDLRWLEGKGADRNKAAKVCRPSIPDDVWEQMVERGARAIHEREMGKGYPIWEEGLADAAACLRAALGISDE